MIDDAVKRLQVLALACTTVKIKAAPDYPIEDAAVLPFSIVHFVSGQSQPDNASTCRFLPVVAVDFHFSRQSLAQAYQQMDAIAKEYSQRLAGDPTLAGAVDTIRFPVDFAVSVAEWDRVTTLMLRFTVPLKSLENPI